MLYEGLQTKTRNTLPLHLKQSPPIYKDILFQLKSVPVSEIYLYPLQCITFTLFSSFYKEERKNGRDKHRIIFKRLFQ